MKASRFNNVVRDGEVRLHHNTLYGGLVAADAKSHAAICRVLKNPPDSAARSGDRAGYAGLLIRGHFLVDDELDELQLCREILERERERHRMLKASILLSYNCNFSCPYCFQRLSRARNGQGVMTDATFRAICEFFEDRLPQYRRLRTVWMGGEPLLYLSRIVSYAKRLEEICQSRGVELSNLIITNGYLLDDKALNAVEAMRNPFLQITIDGPPGAHDARRPLRTGAGSFERILENVRRCIRRGTPLTIRVNVDEANAPCLGGLFDCFDATEIASQKDLVHLARVDCTVTADDVCCARQYERYAALERDILLTYGGRSYLACPPVQRVAGCPGIAGSEYMIDAEGRVYKCPRYMEDPAYAVGNVHDSPVLNGRSGDWDRWDPLSQVLGA
jgi:uncharacterized protein